MENKIDVIKECLQKLQEITPHPDLEKGFADYINHIQFYLYKYASLFVQATEQNEAQLIANNRYQIREINEGIEDMNFMPESIINITRIIHWCTTTNEDFNEIKNRMENLRAS